MEISDGNDQSMQTTTTTTTTTAATVPTPLPVVQSGGLVGVMVPGGPVRTDFAPVDGSGTKLSLTLTCPGDLPSPLSSVAEMVCFVVPNAPIPPNCGLLVYWQVHDGAQTQTGFELLGTLTPDRQSGVFRTGWGTNEQISNLPVGGGGPAVMVTIGVSIESLVEVKNQTVDTWDNRLFVAQKIANDLFHYMQSFDSGNQSGQLQVPTFVFDRWLQRFEARYRRDPNFFMKQQD